MIIFFIFDLIKNLIILIHKSLINFFWQKNIHIHKEKFAGYRSQESCKNI